MTLAFAATNLTTAPYIPSNVENIDSAFISCESMTGIVEIDATPNAYQGAFWGTGITSITGNCPDNIKQAILADIAVG